MDEISGLCRCCSFLITSGVTAVLLWLTFQTNNPSCSVQKFYLPSLNKTLNSTSNSTIEFMIKLENSNKEKGIRYDDVLLSFYDSVNRTRVIADYTIPRFRQGREKTAKKAALATLTDQKAVFRAVLPNGTAVFRVDLATAVRFRVLFWNTKRKKIRVGADVAVNDQGTKVNKKPIKMKSSVGSFSMNRRFVALWFLINCFVIPF